MPQNLKGEILELFRRTPMFTRDGIVNAAFNIYHDERTLMQKLRKLEVEKMIEVTRIGHSTKRKLGYMVKFRLSMNGLDWLSEKTGDDEYAPIVATFVKKTAQDPNAD